jgi:hypothetical protein
VRNNENAIVRQIHALFLNLHNRAVQELPEEMAAPERFEKARERVCWQYQWLVRHDFLRSVSTYSVYEDVIEKGNTLFDWEAAQFSIPIEFSHAAFRFGHSMVRDRYDLNRNNPEVPLRDLFHHAHRVGALDERFAIDWHRFLSATETSMSIDTSVVDALFHLPPETILPFSEAPNPEATGELPVRTLLRGAALRLATGQQVRESLDCRNLFAPSGSAVNEHHPLKVLQQLDLLEQTPLWYFILLEAEIEERGANLGVLGSRLVCEVIEGSLRSDSRSFLSCHKTGWRPTPWVGPSGEFVSIDTFKDLTVALGFNTATA